jgi:hypothetical protein
MKAVRSFGTVGTTRPVTWPHIPEDPNLRTEEYFEHLYENDA